MITPVWIIGFTGHRPKDSPGRSSEEMLHLAPIIRQELAALQMKAVAQGGRAEFLCGVAAGADLIAAREAEGLGMPVHVILPMPVEEFKKDFAGEEFAADWAEAQRFIGLAQGATGGATFRHAHGSQLRDDCYYDVGSQIVYASDAVIALWDGKVAPEVVQVDANTTVISPGRGGTADVVDLATADRMPYLKGKEPKQGYRWLPTPLRRINSVTRAVDGDATNFASAADAGLAEMKAIRHAARMEHGQQHALDTARDLMGFVGHWATDWATKLRRALLWGLILHFFASLIAAVSASGQETIREKAAVAHESVGHPAWMLDWHWAPTNLAALELALVGLAVGFMFWAHCKHAQQRWLELRLATELTRALASAGRLLDPLFPIATDHLPGWRRFCLSVGLIIWRDPATAAATTDAAGRLLTPAERFEAVKGRYLRKRIQDQREHFFKNDPAHRHLWHGIAEWAGPSSAVLAVVFVFIALWHKVGVAMDKDHVHGVDVTDAILYYFLPIALPLLAAAIAALQAVTDVKRRAHVYPDMVERLSGAESYLPAIRTQAALGRFVRRTEEILLDELVGWYAAAKGISH